MENTSTKCDSFIPDNSCLPSVVRFVNVHHTEKMRCGTDRIWLFAYFLKLIEIFFFHFISPWHKYLSVFKMYIHGYLLYNITKLWHSSADCFQLFIYTLWKIFFFMNLISASALLLQGSKIGVKCNLAPKIFFWEN